MQWPNTLEAYGLRFREDGRTLNGFSVPLHGYEKHAKAKTVHYYDGFYDQKNVSLKVYFKAELDSQLLAEVTREVEVHCQLQHE